MIAPVWEP